MTNGTQGPTPTTDELADWWNEHDGEWTIGIDETGACNDYYDVTGFPTLVAIDPEGTVSWRSEGSITASTIVSELETELDAETDDDGAETDDDAEAENGTAPDVAVL